MAEVMKMACWSAEMRGFEAYRDGLTLKDNPHHTETMRLAWIAGFRRGQLSIF